MKIKKAIIKSFDEVNHKVIVQLAGSERAYLGDVPVARNIADTDIIVGRKAAVLFFDEHNAREALVVAVW